VTGALATVRERMLPRDPMQRSAVALAANTGVTSVLGFLYWVVAARYYSPAIVGESAALISAMVLMASIAELNLFNTLIRFLPTAGSNTRRYTLRAYLTVAGAGTLVVLAALPFLQKFALVRDLAHYGPAGVAFVVAALLVWTLFALADSVAIGARAAVWVPVENGLFGVAKLVLLFMFAAAMPRFGVFWSWFLAMIPVLVAMNVLLFSRLLPRHARESAGQSERVSRRDVAAFMTLDNIALLGSTAANYVLPVMVAVLAGNEANGYFFVAWGVATVLEVALVNVAASLTVEGARQRERLGEMVSTLLRRTTVLAVPLVLLLLLTAPMIMSLYGDAYVANSTDLLRVVVLAALPRILIVVWMSLNRVRQRLGQILAVQAVITGSVLGLSWALLPGYGIMAVGVAHLAVQCVVALALVPSVLRVVRGRG